MNASATDMKTQSGFGQLLEVLDDRSRAILCHLWWQRHSDMSELRGVIEDSTDWEILFRLKEIINAASVRLVGKPAVAFEESKTDALTGEKVLFSWWFLERGDTATAETDRSLVDVFADGGTVTIIAQLPGWEQLSGSAPNDGHWSQPIAVSRVEYRNGILQIKLRKVEHAIGDTC